MNPQNTLPGFNAETSLSKANRRYRVTATPWLHGLSVQPARSALHGVMAYCSMKGCCIDMSDIGGPRVCCDGDTCGTDVLI
jgi:hypothetical protein